MRFQLLSVLGVFFLSQLACSPENGGNRPTTLIDQSTQNGFSIFRSGQPEKSMLKSWCKSGVKVVFALNGQGSRYQADLEAECPGTRIVYNVEQDPDRGIDHAFLETFDREVQLAQAQGYGVLFHCNCGCHRTGRLAAYYRLKYNQWTPTQAIDEMKEVGKNMNLHPTLGAQVMAYDDYIHNRTCSQEAKYCVQ